MKSTLTLTVLALLASIAVARADTLMPLASHRAAYEITLAGTDTSKPPSAATPVAATGSDRLRVSRVVVRGLRLEFPAGDRTPAKRRRSNLFGHQFRHVRGRGR